MRRGKPAAGPRCGHPANQLRQKRRPNGALNGFDCIACRAEASRKSWWMRQLRKACHELEAEGVPIIWRAPS
jgi:hypothetical protein